MEGYRRQSEFDEETGETPSAGTVVEDVRNQWPSSSAYFATVFQNMTTADLRKEWRMSETSSPSQPPPSIGGEPADEAGDKDRKLDHDEFFKKVMEELKSQGETGGNSHKSWRN